MSDEPAFPKPRPKASAYREPARPSASADVSDAPRKIVVKRPEPPPDFEARPQRAPTDEKLDAEALLAPIHAERTYWQKQQFAVRHPRITGTVMVLASAFVLVPSIASRLDGVRFHATSAPIYGGGLLLSGLWLLAFGAPVDPVGRMPHWWSAGILGCGAAGALGALFFV